MLVTRGLERARRAVRREVVECLAAVRAARRRTVVAESLACVLAAAAGLMPQLIVRQEQPVLAVLEGLWTVALVLMRRRWPTAAVLATGPLLGGNNVWTLVAVPLIVPSATRRITPPRRAWYAVGTACVLGAVLTVAGGPFRPGTPLEDLAGTGLSAVLLLILPALAGTLLGRRRPLVTLLRERNAYLEQARSLTAAAARMDERNRIAGEMHDLLGHRLSLISVHAGALELAAARQAPPLSGQAELLRTTAGAAMEELREILGVLRHEDDGDLVRAPEGRRGTREDITALVAESRQAGVAVELDWSGPDTADVGPRTRQAMHRLVREALTNVLKHASGAPTRVEVRTADGRIEVSVTNEAPRVKRAPQAGNRIGLVGLDERISLLGGSFAAGPVVNGGFRVAALLPPQPQPNGTAPVAPAAAHVGARAPLSAEILTWPRVLGAGCAAALVILPTVAFLVMLLATAALG